MRRYLTPKQDISKTEIVQQIPIRSPVGIYRRDDGSHRVVAETVDKVVDLGIRDAAVSRKQNKNVPVQAKPVQRGIELTNRDSTNPVTVRQPGQETTLERDDQLIVSDNCVIELGFSTEIRMTAEPDSQTLSRDELEEIFDMAVGENQVQGVSPAAHAATLARSLRQSKSTSVVEVKKIVVEMRNFVEGNTVDGPDYDTVVGKLRQLTDELDAKVSGPLRGTGLDEQRQDELELIADRVERLYD